MKSSLLSFYWSLYWSIALLVIEFKEISPMKYPQNGINGVELKFAVTHFPPFDVITSRSDGNSTYSGSNPPLYNWLSKRLNFTTSYMILNNTATAKHGSSSKLIVHLIEEKMVDSATMGFIPTPERKSKMDFAYFMWTEPHTMVVPLPGEEPRLFAFIRPFQPQVWLLILIATIFLTVSMGLYSKVCSFDIHNFGDATLRKRTFLEYVSRYFVDLVSIMTNQGGTHYTGRFSFRVLVGVWMLVATVLVNCYSSTVISYLTVSKQKPHINSFADLALASNQIGLIVRDDLVIGQQIMEAKTGNFKILGDQVRRNPKQLVQKSSEIIAFLRTGHYAFPFLNSACTTFVANQFKLDGECRFTVTDPLSMYGFWSVVFQKDSKFTAIFNDALIEMWETGLPWFWVKNHTPQAPQCFSKIKGRSHSAGQIPIRLTDLMGAFLVLGVGIVLSVVAFVIENVLALKN